MALLWLRRQAVWASRSSRPAAAARNLSFRSGPPLRCGPTGAPRLRRRACRFAPVAHPALRRVHVRDGRRSEGPWNSSTSTSPAFRSRTSTCGGRGRPATSPISCPRCAHAGCSDFGWRFDRLTDRPADKSRRQRAVGCEPVNPRNVFVVDNAAYVPRTLQTFEVEPEAALGGTRPADRRGQRFVLENHGGIGRDDILVAAMCCRHPIPELQSPLRLACLPDRWASRMRSPGELSTTASSTPEMSSRASACRLARPSVRQDDQGATTQDHRACRRCPACDRSGRVINGHGAIDSASIRAD